MQDLHAVTGGGRSRVESMQPVHPASHPTQDVHGRDRSCASEGQDMQDLHAAGRMATGRMATGRSVRDG